MTHSITTQRFKLFRYKNLIFKNLWLKSNRSWISSLSSASIALIPFWYNMLWIQLSRLHSIAGTDILYNCGYILRLHYQRIHIRSLGRSKSRCILLSHYQNGHLTFLDDSVHCLNEAISCWKYYIWYRTADQRHL